MWHRRSDLRRTILILCLVLITGLLLTGRSYGGPYFLLTGGGGGRADAGSFGGEIGYMGEKALMGVGFSAVFSATDWEGIYYDPPWWGIYERYDSELETYLAGGVRVLRGGFLVGTVGYSFQDIRRRLCVGSVPWTETRFRADREYLTLSGRLQYMHERLVISGGYHSRRGIVGGIGFSL